MMQIDINLTEQYIHLCFWNNFDKINEYNGHIYRHIPMGNTEMTSISIMGNIHDGTIKQH